MVNKNSDRPRGPVVSAMGPNRVGLPVTLAALLLGLCASGMVLAWGYPNALGDGPRAVDQRLAQVYRPWPFRPIEPSNARGVPPAAAPAGQADQAAVPGPTPAYPAAQPGQLVPGQYPAGQLPPGTYATAPPTTGRYAPAQVAPGYYGQGQYAPAPYQGNQYPAGQFPPGQYATPGQYAPPGQFATGRPEQQYAPAQYPAAQYPSPQYAPYGRQSGAVSAREPRIEVELSDNQPYVQENVMVRLRVVSDDNLAKATPELSAIDEVLFETIAGPTVSTRGSGSNREIVNEFVMAMTPLIPGDIDVGPIKVSGTHANGAAFEALDHNPLRLQVRPAMSTVRPWLPLESLTLRANMDNDGTVEEGRPVTLMLEIEASGATGEQLPTLEPMLHSDDFRVYREQTLTDTQLSRDGAHLIGKRTEYYTLVPHSGGRLQLPEIRLGWWNVETGTREASTLPVRTFEVEGESGLFGFGRATERAAAGNMSAIWMPLAGLLLLLTGYWGGVWLQGRSKEGGPLWPRVLTGLSEGATAASDGLARASRWLDPSPLVARVRGAIAGALPEGTRLYHCVRAAEQANTPQAWCHAFQGHAYQHLQVGVRESLPRTADRILRLRPGANAEQVLRLMQQLDRAMYGREQIDFDRWKQEFRRAMRPGVGWVRGVVASRIRRGRLPELNPSLAAR